MSGISFHSHSEKPRTAVIYNRYLHTLGGGERSSVECARALEDLGCEITLLTESGADITLERLIEVFGVQPKRHWELVKIAEEEIEAYCRTREYQVFVNHTFSSYLPSPCRLGIYFLMFPQPVSSERLLALESYRAICCNSPFTELHTQLRWGKRFPTSIIPPPISQAHFDAAAIGAKKEKLVLNVGRFNVDGHSKCQKQAIQAFVRLHREGVIDPDWRMLVVGHLNEGAHNTEYFNECADLDPSLVKVEKNISFSRLASYYQRAAVLFQLTGIGFDFGIMPDRCEHLGLVAMDALCYGTIPVVYQRSGAAMLSGGEDAICTFYDYEELAGCMRWISANFGKTPHLAQIRRCRAEAGKFSYPAFSARIAQLLAN